MFPFSYNGPDGQARTVGYMHRNGGKGNAIFAGIAINDDHTTITTAAISEQLVEPFCGVFVTGWSGTHVPDSGDDDEDDVDGENEQQRQQMRQQILLCRRQSEISQINVRQFIAAVLGMEKSRAARLLHNLFIGHMDVEDEFIKCPFNSPKLGHSVDLLRLNQTHNLTLRMLAFDAPGYNVSGEGIHDLMSYLGSPNCTVEGLRVEVIFNSSLMKTYNESWNLMRFAGQHDGVLSAKSIKKLSLAVIKPQGYVQRYERTAARFPDFVADRPGNVTCFWLSRYFAPLINEGGLLLNLNCLELDGFALNSRDLEQVMKFLWNTIWNTKEDIRIQISNCMFSSDPCNPYCYKHTRMIPTKSFLIANPLSRKLDYAQLPNALHVVQLVREVEKWHQNLLNLCRHITERNHFSVGQNPYDFKEFDIVDMDVHKPALLYEHLRCTLPLLAPIQKRTKKRPHENQIQENSTEKQQRKSTKQSAIA